MDVHTGAVLQPGRGPVPGRHYLAARPEAVRAGAPGVDEPPVLRVRSGETVTVDTVSHEGLMPDQGRDPVAYFAEHGVPRAHVLDDAVALARDGRTGVAPYLATGPVQVAGAVAGDVLRVEVLALVPRVPYGVVSDRHTATAPGTAPVPGRRRRRPVAAFTPLRPDRGGALTGVPRGCGTPPVPLDPSPGLVVTADDGDGAGALDLQEQPDAPHTASDVRYLPVLTDGALLSVGDPHLGAAVGPRGAAVLEGPLRATFRLTVCRPGSGDAPPLAYAATALALAGRLGTGALRPPA